MRTSIVLLVLTFSSIVASAAAPPPPRAQITMMGAASGAQNPLGGAHGYLYEPVDATTGTTHSKSLLQPNAGGAPVTRDASGNYYATTAASNGGFELTGDYTCDVGIPVYLYMVGGDAQPGGTEFAWNTAIAQMAFVGICPVGGVFSSSMFIDTDEVSTVAMAYAVAGFATDPTHISYNNGSTTLQGIVAAFSNINNLVVQSTGQALATTPSGAIVTQQKINTLANAFAICVNNGNLPSGSISSDCLNLFDLATSTGTSAGTIPPDTGTAAINIAHNAGLNVQAIYNLAPPTNQDADALSVGPVFQPYLTAPPNDWAIGITFTGNGIGDPWSIAIDSNGNAWVAGADAGTTFPGDAFEGGFVVEISSGGNYLSPSTGYDSSFFSTQAGTPTAIAIDSSNQAWVTTIEALVILGSSGNAVSTPLLDNVAPSGCSNSKAYDGASGVAFDTSGNAWVTSGTIFKLDSQGNNQSQCGFTYPGIVTPLGIAVDSNSNIWIADFGSDEVAELNTNGQSVQPPITSALLLSPNGIAIDTQNNVWVADFAGESAIEIQGSEITHQYGSGGSNGIADLTGVVIDGSNNPWFSPSNNNDIGAVGLIGSTGAAITGPNGFVTGLAPENNLDAHFSDAIDPSGNVWIANTFSDSVTELIGAAVPVSTPIAPHRGTN
jgi:streptogramin lyase